jgi:hypothetical protein
VGDASRAEALAKRVSFLNSRPDVSFAVFGSQTFVAYPGDCALYWNTLENGVDDLDRFLGLDPPGQTAGPIWRRAALDGRATVSRARIAF